LKSRPFNQLLSRALLDLFDSPDGVLRDERFLIACRIHQGGEVLTCPDVAKRDADVAEKTAPLHPPDRRTAKHVPKLLFIESKEIA